MIEKAFLMLLSAVLGGGLTATFAASNTAGRLTAVEATLVRIETRLDMLVQK